MMMTNIIILLMATIVFYRKSGVIQTFWEYIQDFTFFLGFSVSVK